MDKSLYELSNQEIEDLIKRNFGLNLEKILRDNGITKSKLSIDLHFSSKQLWSYQSGISTPSLATVLRIANYLNTSVENLIYDSIFNTTDMSDNKDFQTDTTQKLLEIQRILERLVKKSEENL